MTYLNNEAPWYAEYLNPRNKKYLVYALIAVIAITFLVNLSSAQQAKDLPVTAQGALAIEDEQNKRFWIGMVAAGVFVILILLSGSVENDEIISLREAYDIASTELNDIIRNPRRYGIDSIRGEIKLDLTSARHPNPDNLGETFEYEIGMTITPKKGGLPQYYSIKVEALRYRAGVTAVNHLGSHANRRFKGETIYYRNKIVPVSQYKEYKNIEAEEGYL